MVKMKTLTLTDEATLLCLKTIRCSDFDEIVALVRWSDDLDKRLRSWYDNRPAPMRGYDENPIWIKVWRNVAANISWARGIAFGKMLQLDPGRCQGDITRRVVNF